MAPLPDLVPRLRRFKELRIDADTAEQLLKIGLKAKEMGIRIVTPEEFAKMLEDGEV